MVSKIFLLILIFIFNSLVAKDIKAIALEYPPYTTKQIPSYGLSFEILNEALKEYDFTFDTVIVGGDHAKAIIGVYKEGNFDLVVMGAYGHSRLRELVLGSTTVQIMRSVNCPLVLCR